MRKSEYLKNLDYILCNIIIGVVKMNSSEGQVLTWNEDCLQCSVCQAGISLDNVVFNENSSASLATWTPCLASVISVFRWVQISAGWWWESLLGFHAIFYNPITTPSGSLVSL